MTNGKIIVHGGMVYHCRDCGAYFLMFLERGLEEEDCKDRKPVPFVIACPFCHGFRAFDVSGVLPLHEKKYAELSEGEPYFANRQDIDYGVPVYTEHQRRLFEGG